MLKRKIHSVNPWLKGQYGHVLVDTRTPRTKGWIQVVNGIYRRFSSKRLPFLSVDKGIQGTVAKWCVSWLSGTDVKVTLLMASFMMLTLLKMRLKFAGFYGLLRMRAAQGKSCITLTYHESRKSPRQRMDGVDGGGWFKNRRRGKIAIGSGLAGI